MAATDAPQPGLTLIAVPIGAARDITLRALDALAGADVLAAEDTRSLRRLMEIHGIALGERPLLSYHDQSPPGARAAILAHLRAGARVVYAAEAGTPLVADPGYRLVQAALAEGLSVLAAPGPSAVLAALAVAGLPTDRFLFAGFPPAAAAARRRWIAEMSQVPATLVLCESPRRAAATLADLAGGLGPTRRAALCRELTKRHEEVLRGTLAELAAQVADRTLKGEVVLCVDRAGAAPADPDAIEVALREALGRARLKEAAVEVADRFGRPRREVYQMGLRLKDPG